MPVSASCSLVFVSFVGMATLAALLSWIILPFSVQQQYMQTFAEAACPSVLTRLCYLPCSILWLLRFPPYGEPHVKAEAAARGVDPARIIFTDVAAKPIHIARSGAFHTCLFLACLDPASLALECQMVAKVPAQAVTSYIGCVTYLASSASGSQLQM